MIVQAAVPAGAVNLSLRMMWRRAANFAVQVWFSIIAKELCDVARCVEFPVVPLHRLRTGRRVDQRISGTPATPGGVRTAGGGRGAKNLCRRAFPGFCGTLHHHAQYAARCADRTPPLRICDAGDHPGRLLEPDVRYIFPDDTARRRTAGLNGTAMPESPPPGDQ